MAHIFSDLTETGRTVRRIIRLMAGRKEKTPAPVRNRWTLEKPTKPGWYWYRALGADTELLVVQVDGAGYFQWPDGGFSEARQTEGEWAGPLDPPEDSY